MALVIIESPFRAIEGEDPVFSRLINKQYLQACIRDCLRRAEAPFASHQMYTDALRDSVLSDRELGLHAGFEWHFAADYSAVYTDRGITDGMMRGIAHAQNLNIPVEYRTLGGEWTLKTSG